MAGYPQTRTTRSVLSVGSITLHLKKLIQLLFPIALARPKYIFKK